MIFKYNFPYKEIDTNSRILTMQVSDLNNQIAEGYLEVKNYSRKMEESLLNR